MGKAFVTRLLFLAACGGPQVDAGGEAPEPGDSYAEPSMTALPSLPVHGEELTEHMRFGWTLAEESFQHEMPPAPPSGETIDFQRWADGPLRRWLERKTRTVEAARRELDQAAAESHLQRIVAGAVVGLMYQDVARALRDIPVPAEIQTEPEIAQVFREILEAQAAPFLEHARRAYRACMLNARSEPETMAHWGRFCEARWKILPPPRE